MSSLTNINNNTRVVNVGRTTPVAPGQQPAAKSIPVVLASDQTAVPVIEQNKVQSEVSLSLLGIPRSEVALGIFADVNTYDVNPTEWSSSPQYYNRDVTGNGFGIKHLPTEAGALVEAPRDQKAVLTSKRFFRYQPGRVSAATFGVKTSVNNSHFARNPVIRKYGIFDNFDGYYWESKQSGQGDNFSVVRRTQSLLKFPGSPFGLTTEILRKPTGNANAGDTFTPFNQTDDYRATGKEGSKIEGKYYVRERSELLHDSITLAEAAFNNLINDTGSAFKSYYDGLSATAQQVYKDKCHRDAVFWMNMFAMDMEWGGDAHTRINTKNYTTAILSTADREEELYTELKALILNDAANSVQSATYATGTNSIHNTSAGVRSYATGGAGTKLTALIGLTLQFFGSNNLGAVDPTNAARIAASQAITNQAAMQFGDKSRVETLFDTRVHYWSYFVSSFAYNQNKVDDKLNGYQTYEFKTNSINAAFMPPGDFSALVGYELSSDSSTGQYYPYDTTMTIQASDLPNSNDPITLNADQALALNEYYQNIKYKCARDLEYVINGYKNDLIGGGNAETLYNASMYYRGSGLSIYTQTDGGIPQEIEKHKHLRDWIETDLLDTALRLGNTNQERIDLGNGVDSGLAKIIIENFAEETQQGVELGKRGFAGNLIVFRDGLLMTHAAVNDPNLLKEVEQIKTHISVPSVESQPTRFKITEGVVTFGQKIRVVTTDNQQKISEANSSANLGSVTVDIVEARYNKIYNVSRVYGPTGTEFSLQDQDGNDIYAYRNVASGLIADDIYVELVVPFIGDQTYNPGYYRRPNSERAEGTIQDLDGANVTTTYTEADDPFPVGIQWPYRYSSSTQLSDTTANYIGHIDTSVDPSTASGTSSIRTQYDDINFNPEYINWIKNNVKPEFWGVYEYRVPRSRFSHDKLDGKTSKRLYSDLATGASGIVRPGMEVLDDDGVWVDAESEYDFDFTKVTMLKIEFSWYGAVGALFLAYVPIGNGEARWVRVHHLRASNQLKIASLGNATLPITYNVWGGGSPDTLGDEETKTHTYGTSQSHHIVKYGASYYIDGGDRGTVRLYSHNNNDAVKGYGKLWKVNTSNNAGADIDGKVSMGTQTMNGVAYPDLVYFMGAQVKTNNPIDTGIKVVWVDEANSDIYLTKQPQGTGLHLIPDRGDLVYGLETKDLIYSTVEGNPVRNRVQVYPTKMSTANLSNFPIRLQMKRTPVFQTLTQTGTDGSTDVTLAINGEYTVSPNNLPLVVNETGPSGYTYLQNGEEIFGWFQGTIADVDSETIFGRLYKKTNEYYFEVLQSFNGVVKLNDGGFFLKDGRFARNTNETGEIISVTGETAVETPLADQLTSVKAISNIVVPIPNTGANVATLYLQPNGTEQVNLDTYFDYNKEYLSYPLTDQAETLYFAIDADKDVDEKADVAIGLTWEEQ